MKRNVITTVLCILGLHITYAQSFQWAKQTGGTGSDWGLCITTDDSGNVFTTGFFQGTVDFDPGPGIFNLTSIAFQDGFVSKLDSAGNFKWAKNIGGRGFSIFVDNNGNIYTAGNFNGTTDFDPGAGVFNYTSAGYSDIFVSKLNAAGNLIWAKRMGGTGNDEVESMAVDPAGNVYTTGSFEGTADFDPGAGIYNLTPGTGIDIFVSKLDSSGNFGWAKSMGGAGFDAAFSIAIDASANVYTTGTFNGTADFDPSAGVFNLVATAGNNIFVSKLNASGNFVWAKNIDGTSGGDTGYSITIDGSGNVYTTGWFSATADFNPGPGTFNLTSSGGSDIFISKLDGAGNFIWAKQMGGTNTQQGRAIKTDSSGNVYTTGYFNDTADFNPGVGTYNLSSAGAQDIFISKLDSSGSFICAAQMGGPDNDYGYSITINASDVYTTGYFTDTADFDPGAGIVDLNSAGGLDIFITKMELCSAIVPAANFISSDTAFCDEGGKCIDFTDLSTGNPTSWKWFFPGAVPDTSTQQDPTNICYYIPGSYAVTLIVSNTSGSDTLVVTPMIIFCTSPAAPVITFDTTSSLLLMDTLCTDSACGYQWYLNGSPIPGAIQRCYILTTCGTYAVYAITCCGCGRMSANSYDPCTSVNELHGSSLRVYPNPARNQFTVYGLQFIVGAEIKLYNVLGENVYSLRFENRKSEISIDVSSMVNGIYFVEISDGEKKYRTKFVKE